MIEAKKRAKLRTFEVVAFGCHDRAYDQVAEFFRRATKIQTFLFVEYFCVEPVEYSKLDGFSANGIEVFFPFIRRIVEENQFLWIPSKDDDKEYQLRPKLTDVLDLFRYPENFTLTLKAGEEEWREGWKPLSWWKQNRKWRRGNEWRVDRQLISGFGKTAQMAYFKNVHESPRKRDDPTRLEYALLVHPWKRNYENASLVTFPIATDAVFYGYLIVVFPGSITLRRKRQLLRKLGGICDTLYVPLLTLLTESILEDELKETIENEKAGGTWKSRAKGWFDKSYIPFGACDTKAVEKEVEEKQRNGEQGSPGHKSCPAAVREYERYYELPLHKCWTRRVQFLESLSDAEEKDRLDFVKRLPLAKYYVASPGLLENIKLALSTNFEKPKMTESLQAALVYGGAGSGKDVMAQLLPIFSDDYFECATHILNMAAIRPPAITGPLFQGLRLSGPSRHPGHPETADDAVDLDLEQSPTIQAHIAGLFLEAKRLDQQRLKKRGTNGQPGAAFILDELNSLDIDLQGLLLRVLEQGEVMPLGGLGKAYVQHLVIGVVNEDPEEISREYELKNLLIERGKLGSLVSSLLYEVLRRTRRLRDDLYHRLKRQCYIHLPEMKERRADVPMLFYHTVLKKEAKSIKKDLGVLVELGAYRLLMDPNLTWPGNIRQIQAVARKSVEKARKDIRVDLPAVTDLLIQRSHVQSALADEFNNAFGVDDAAQGR